MKKFLLICALMVPFGQIFTNIALQPDLEELFFNAPETPGIIDYKEIEEDEEEEEYFDAQEELDDQIEDTKKVSKPMVALYLVSIYGAPFVFSFYQNILPYMMTEEEYQMMQFLTEDPEGSEPAPDFITDLGTQALRQFWGAFNNRYLSKLVPSKEK
ncbi:MAG TPA: hypothetical protein QGF02_03720 [Candidatus Babeliales bacterium]|nr:hypothetical protein [Candidatus Babeliales bacterium]